LFNPKHSTTIWFKLQTIIEVPFTMHKEVLVVKSKRFEMRNNNQELL